MSDMGRGINWFKNGSKSACSMKKKPEIPKALHDPRENCF